MSKLRIRLLKIAAATSVFAATSASAASFELWDGAGWSNNGIVHLVGPTTINGLSCTTDFTVAVNAGVANVIAAGFSGSLSACSAITAQHLPWPVSSPLPYTGANPPFAGAPILTPALSSLQISGVRILVLGGPCPSAIGVSSIAGVLDSSYQIAPPLANNRFVFKATLATCTFQTRTNLPPYSLVAQVPMRVVP